MTTDDRECRIPQHVGPVHYTGSNDRQPALEDVDAPGGHVVIELAAFRALSLCPHLGGSSSKNMIPPS